MPDNEIYTNLPEWNEPGTEPTQQKKDNGWQPGERPPAPWLNWWMHRVYRSLLQIRDAFVGHRDATSGVHGIPEGEDIATEGYVDDEIEPVAQGLSEHVGDTDNPHGVTKAQVGLSNVDNVKQAPKSEFDAHESDASAHHTRYTNAEAVAAVKAADGAGSGFDADLLDGKHGSAYANASHSHGASDLPSASTSAKGIVQLSTSTSSTSTSLAATPSAVKAAYDLANSKADSIATVNNKKAGYAVYAP